MVEPKSRITDTSLWLHNKLGSNDLWSAGSICSQLNQDVLRNIKECFINLQSQVKLKLILSFLHIPRRNTEEWKRELDKILDMALEDMDQWVSMVAELLKKYPSDHQINFDIDHNSAVFTDLVGELKKIVKKHSDKSILPLECLYLNRNALHAQVGHLPQPSKHFTLKRKSKSAALRAELLQKSNDAASVKKAAIASIGNRVGISDSAPKNISRIGMPTSIRPPRAMIPKVPIKKDGGIKMLDIAEQPFGRDAKRKKKNPDDKDGKATEPEPPTENQPQTKAVDAAPRQPQPQQQQQIQQQQPILAQTLQQPVQVSALPPLPQQPIVPVPQPQQPQQPYIISQPPPQPVTLNSVQTGLGGERRLVLSKDQMLQAQEMFSNSNCVSRPEKALILGFMAGSRDNPCPQLGNVVTIKLNEKEENILHDGIVKPVRLETHYQMNYETGEGKQIKKYVLMETNPSQTNSQQPNQQDQRMYHIQQPRV